MPIQGSGFIGRSTAITRKNVGKKDISSSHSSFSLNSEDTTSLHQASDISAPQTTALFSLSASPSFSAKEKAVLQWGEDQLDALSMLQQSFLSNESLLCSPLMDDAQAPHTEQWPKDHIACAIDARRRVERAKIKMSQNLSS
jgi:hypothetical protein